MKKKDETDKISRDNKNEDNNESSNWYLIAFIIPLLTSCLGVWYGTKYSAFWTGVEIFLVPGFIGFLVCAGLAEKDKESKSLLYGSALFVLSIAAGIHLGIILNSAWIGAAIWGVIFCISIYIFIKGFKDNPN